MAALPRVGMSDSTFLNGGQQQPMEAALAASLHPEAMGTAPPAAPPPLSILGDDPALNEGGVTHVEMPDGGIQIQAEPEKFKEVPEFDANLAEHMDDSELNSLGSNIVDWVQQDKESRADWDNQMIKGMEYLGLTMEERSYPFPGASGVFDPLLMEAVCRWQATASAELMPAQGPVKTQIIGVSSEQLEQQAWRVREFMNLYLTDLAPEYVEENDQMFFWLPLVGSTFKKVYQDPIMQRPVSRFILPDNFIVKYTTTDLETCQRMTQIIPMTQRELKLRQLSGFYRDIELGDAPNMPSMGQDILKDKARSIEGLAPSGSGDPKDNLRMIYECHIDMNLKGFEHQAEVEDDDPKESLGGEESGDPKMEKTGLPLPYIVTVDMDTKHVLAIRRNWREHDPNFKKILYFVHFRFIPGLGFYGFGYAHILGNSAKGATALRRQMIDAETLAMFPGGLRAKGMRLTDNNLTIGPCEFAEIDTGGLPIQNAVMPMPYKGASDVSLALLQTTVEAAKSMVGNSEIAVGEGRQDAPVGTTVALLEAALKLQSATIKRAHRAFRREFKLIAQLFGTYLPQKPYPFPVQGGMQAIMKSDFSSQIDVIPVSDPNIASFAQRMMRADAIVQSATQAPQIHNLYQAYRQRYVEMGIDDARLNQILPPPNTAQPSDPLSENMNATQGKPIAVGPMQDHKAHIAAHKPLVSDPQNANPSMLAHIAEHTAWDMRVQVQAMLGIQLPPPGTKLPPQIENQIAVLVAKAMKLIDNPSGETDPTPEKIAWEQVKVEAQKVQADIAKSEADAQVQSYKARLQFESDEKERANRLQIERMRQHHDRGQGDNKNATSILTARIAAAAKPKPAPKYKH